MLDDLYYIGDRSKIHDTKSMRTVDLWTKQYSVSRKLGLEAYYSYEPIYYKNITYEKNESLHGFISPFLNIIQYSDLPTILHTLLHKTWPKNYISRNWPEAHAFAASAASAQGRGTGTKLCMWDINAMIF